MAATDALDNLIDRLARARTSFIVTLLAAKAAVHWQALYLLAHPERSARDALLEASSMIDARSWQESWGCPVLVAVVVSGGYPWLASGLRLSAELAATMFSRTRARIEGLDLPSQVRTLTQTVAASEGALRAELDARANVLTELVSVWTRHLRDDTVRAFPRVPAGRFYARTPNGDRLIKPDKQALGGDTPFVVFLDMPTANIVLAASRSVWFPSQPELLTLLSDGRQVPHDAAAATAFGEPMFVLEQDEQDDAIWHVRLPRPAEGKPR